MDNRFMNRAGFRRGAALAVAAPCASRAELQSRRRPPRRLEEIVVTAQKRSENLQNVPIAITAFTAESLESRGIQTLQQISNLTPNVNLDGGAPFLRRQLDALGLHPRHRSRRFRVQSRPRCRRVPGWRIPRPYHRRQPESARRGAHRNSQGSAGHRCLAATPSAARSTSSRILPARSLRSRGRRRSAPYDVTTSQ